jgi:hypothetical protein
VKACSVLLAAHQMKCACALAGMATWRFSSHQKVMKSLCVGTWHNPLHSCDRTLLRKQRFVSQDPVRVVLSEARMLETQHKAYNTMMFKL